MKVFEFLEKRQAQWKELETLCIAMEGRSFRSLGGTKLARFAALYRSACADLALADAYHLPPTTVDYLHNLVGRAHNQFYRVGRLDLLRWIDLFFRDLPKLLFFDMYLRAAFAIFWGAFLFAMQFTMLDSNYARSICGEEQVAMMEDMYSGEVNRGGISQDIGMSGFYIGHNTGIGLQCFAYGLLAGVGGLFSIVYNAMVLGSIFGYMATIPQGGNFYRFVLAHGPCELTAIVLSGAAGMRLGFALFFTKGKTRLASIRTSAEQALPIMGLAAVLFFFAALIEGFISPSALPAEIKAAVAFVTSAAIMAYLVLLGMPTSPSRQGESIHAD